MEEKNTSKQEESTKPLFSIIIEVYPNGDRQLKIDRDVEKNINPPLVIVREMLSWGRDFINDRIVEGVVKSHLKQFGDEKIIKPGFRPMKIIDKLRGK